MRRNRQALFVIGIVPFLAWAVAVQEPTAQSHEPAARRSYPAATAAGMQSPAFRPVTDARLNNPDPADWLHWRRAPDGQGYSPLVQINRENVADLRLVWSWAMEPGSQQTGPLVADGVMYLASPGNIVHALDAATGELLWEYRREFPEGVRGAGRTNRNLSMYGDKVFLNTADAHLVALDRRTGAVVWDAQVADRAKGFTFTSGSVVVNGRVISSLGGCSRFDDESCYITAHDADTGRELWRTSTIARPGEPGGDTWGDLPAMFRAGGDAWIAGSYDPSLNLVYWGTAQAKPWTRAARGTDGDALYTNSTLAIDPETGRLKWYYQHLPGETQDMDETFERILVDLDGRKSVFTMGKLGILWHLDRETGAFRDAFDLGYQNIVNVDRKTGRVEYRPNMIPKLNEEIIFCPSFSGIKSWRAMAYSPETEAFYIPVELTCQRSIFTEVEKREGGGGSGQGLRENRHHPDSGGNLGEFVALHHSGKILWKHRQRTPFNSAALTTAGGLAFIGDWDRYANAYDVATGELRWQTRLPTSVQGFPITYAVAGRQYVAIPVGVGALSWSTIPLALTPEKHRPETGNGIFVFALPSR